MRCWRAPGLPAMRRCVRRLSERFDITTLTREQIENYAALTGETTWRVVQDSAQAAESARPAIDLLEAARTAFGEQLTLLRPLPPRLLLGRVEP